MRLAGDGDGGLHEMNGGIAQAVRDDVVTERGLDAGLPSELCTSAGVKRR